MRKAILGYKNRTKNIPVSMDSLTMQVPVSSTASQATIARCLGSSMMSPGTSSSLEMLSYSPLLLSTRTVSV